MILLSSAVESNIEHNSVEQAQLDHEIDRGWPVHQDDYAFGLAHVELGVWPKLFSHYSVIWITGLVTLILFWDHMYKAM